MTARAPRAFAGGFVFLAVCGFPAWAQTTVTGDVSADDHYAIYTADYEGPFMTVTSRGNGNNGSDVCTAEPYNFTTDDGFLYIVAFSDDTHAQGLVHDLSMNGLPIRSGSGSWQVCPTGIGLDAYPEPTADALAAEVRACNELERWTAPTVGGDNGSFNTSRWCGGPVTGVDTDAAWTWYDSGTCSGSISPFEPGCDHGEYLIFRHCMPTRVHGEVTADDYYGVYTADFEGPGMTVTAHGDGDTGDGVCVPESYDFTTTDSWLYIAAFSDDSGTQGLVHDLMTDDIVAFSGRVGWEVCPTNTDLDAYPAPTPLLMASRILKCGLQDDWTNPATGGHHGLFNTDTWCGGPVPGVDVQSRWEWHESNECPGPDAPFEPGCNHNEFLIFRRWIGCRELDITWTEPRRRLYPQEMPQPVWVDPRGITTVNDADNGVLATLVAIEEWEVDGVGDLIIPLRGSPDDPEGVPPFVLGDGRSVIRLDPQPGVCEGFCIGAATETLVDDTVSGDCGNHSYWRRVETDISINGPGHAWTSAAETAAEGDCDVIAEFPAYSGEWYIEQVALHEIGHYLGLAHPPGDIAMMGLADQCESHKTTVPIDDVAAIREGYMCSFSQGGVPVDSDGDGQGQDLDCDDQDPSSFSGGVEVCDLRDNDCNGLIDGDDGLSCAAACLIAAGGPSVLQVEPGPCACAAIPGYRNVFVRGSLDELRSAGSVSAVSVAPISCPQPWTYDRAEEASELTGDDEFFLVRDVAEPDFGTDSAATPRTPAEASCP